AARSMRRMIGGGGEAARRKAPEVVLEGAPSAEIVPLLGPADRQTVERALGQDARGDRVQNAVEIGDGRRTIVLPAQLAAHEQELEVTAARLERESLEGLPGLAPSAEQE